MTDTSAPSSPFHDVIFEDIPPQPPRIGGKGREPVKWEDHLSPLEDRLLEKPARLWAYENKTGATSRMAAVKGRLTTAVPHKNWEFKVRPVPNTSPQLYGVYAVFHGDYTPDQVQANAADRQKRREAIQAGRTTQTASDPAAAPSAAPEAPQTPKERLAQKAAAK